jgi:hypothetical protein
MKRLVILACVGPLALTTVALAQPLAESAENGGAVAAPSVAAPQWNEAAAVPPGPAAPQAAPVPSLPIPITPPAAPAAVSPGEAAMSPEARAHEMHLLQAQAQAESIHRAAVARAEQRTRRLESQRWFGVSNSRPNASVDPFDGDYAPFWASIYPFYPLRWVASGNPWGFVEAQ